MWSEINKQFSNWRNIAENTAKDKLLAQLFRTSCRSECEKERYQEEEKPEILKEVGKDNCIND